MIERLHSHGARIHAQRASQVAGNAVHPFEAGETRGAGRCRKLLQFHTDTSRDLLSFDTVVGKASRAKMGHDPRESPIPHNQVGTPSHDHEGNPAIMAEADQLGESLLRFRLHPKACRTTHPHGRVSGKRLMQPDIAGPHDLENLVAKLQIGTQERSGLVNVSGSQCEDNISHSRRRRGFPCSSSH